MSVVDLTRGRSRSRGSMSSRSRRRPRSSSSLSSSRSSRSGAMYYRTVALKGIHSFERSVTCPFQLNSANTQGFIDTSSGVGIAQGKFLSVSFSLQNIIFLGSAGTINVPVPTSTDFTNLFDQFRIDGVEITFVSTSTNSSTSTPTTYMPILWAFNDYDDGTLPTVTNQFLEREGMRIISFADTNIKKHRCSPRVAGVMFQGGVIPSYGIMGSKQWIDISYPQTPYFSTKLYYDTVGANINTVNANLNMIVKLKMSFKGVR